MSLNQFLKKNDPLRSEVKTGSIKCNTKKNGIERKKIKRKETDKKRLRKKLRKRNEGGKKLKGKWGEVTSATNV